MQVSTSRVQRLALAAGGREAGLGLKRGSSETSWGASSVPTSAVQ